MVYVSKTVFLFYFSYQRLIAKLGEKKDNIVCRRETRYVTWRPHYRGKRGERLG